jgi:hypothetical protein
LLKIPPEGSITTLIPTAFSSAWMNTAKRIESCELVVSRSTVGLATPDFATRLRASEGSNGGQGTLIAAYHLVFDGGIGVQLGCSSPP